MFLVSLDRCCCWWKWCLFAFRAGYQLINETSSRWCLFPKVDPWIYPLPKSTRSQLLWLGMAQWLKMNLLKVGAKPVFKDVERKYQNVQRSWRIPRMILQSRSSKFDCNSWKNTLTTANSLPGCPHTGTMMTRVGFGLHPKKKRSSSRPTTFHLATWFKGAGWAAARSTPLAWSSSNPRRQNGPGSLPFWRASNAECGGLQSISFHEAWTNFPCGSLKWGKSKCWFHDDYCRGKPENIGVWKTDSIFGQAMTSLSPNGGCLVANPVKSVTIDLPSGNLTEFNRKLVNMAIYSGFTHQKWWFSIVMLVYQRVQCIAQHVVHMCIFSLTMLDTWKMPESHHSGLTTISLKMVDKSIHLSVMPTGFGVYYYCIYDIYIYIILYILCFIILFFYY